MQRGLNLPEGAPNPTPRQRRILSLLAEGYSYREIAQLMSAKPRTVIAQMQRMRDAFAPTNEAVIAIAIHLGWIAAPKITVTLGRLKGGEAPETRPCEGCPHRCPQIAWTPPAPDAKVASIEAATGHAKELP